MANFAIGVDLGGTNLRVAAITDDGTLSECLQVATEAAQGRDKVVSNIISGIRKIRDHRASDRLLGVGVCTPGLIRLREGVIVTSPNLPGWDNFPLRKTLESRLGCPVVLENDANAAALGEVWLGAGRDVEDLVLLTLGTGIGGGVVKDGKVLHGQDGMAGELGHITVDPHSKVVCGCGNYGCVEAHASATAIQRMAEEAIIARRSNVLSKLAASHGEISASLVEEAAQEGDPEAIRIFERMGVALGRGLATLVNVFNFHLYLLAGGVLAAWDWFAPSMFEEVEKRSYTYCWTNTRIEKARLGNKAGIYGAAYLPIRQLGLASGDVSRIK